MSTQTRPSYWNPYVAGVGLGITLFIAVLLTGNGLGASGGLARLSGFLMDTVAGGHVDGSAYWAGLARGAGNPLTHRLVFLGLGAILGGLVSGLVAGRVKGEVVKGPRIPVSWRLVAAFAGGSLVGFAARLARGCTSGQALSGGMVMSAGSWLFMFAVFGGAYAIAYFTRRLWR